MSKRLKNNMSKRYDFVVSKPDSQLGHQILAIGNAAAKKTRLKEGERLCSSDIDDLVELGYSVKEQLK